MSWSVDTCQNKVSADKYHRPYCGLKFTASRGHVFLWSWPLTKCWLSIGSRAHIGLTCWKQGRIVRKPVNADPGLKVNRIITFSSIQMFFFCFFVFLFFCCFVLCVWWLLKVKTEDRECTENLTAKLQNSNQNSTFFWVSLIGLWTTRPRSYAFRLS